MRKKKVQRFPVHVRVHASQGQDVEMNILKMEPNQRSHVLLHQLVIIKIPKLDHTAGTHRGLIDGLIKRKNKGLLCRGDQEVEVGGVKVQEAGVPRAEVQGAGVQRAEVREAGVQRVEVQGAGIQKVEAQRVGTQKVGVQGAGALRVEVQGAEVAVEAIALGTIPIAIIAKEVTTLKDIEMVIETETERKIKKEAHPEGYMIEWQLTKCAFWKSWVSS